MANLSDKAMLVRLSISQWTARKYDKRVSAKVAEEYQTGADVGRYNKVLVAEESIKRIGKTATDARTYHYHQTLPWGDDGSRMLPAANYLPYTQRMQEYRQAFEREVVSFIDAYPDLVDDARARLNGMFNAADYPTPGEIGRRYGFDVGVMPLPAAGDFRVNLQAQEVDAIRQDIETRTQQAQAQALRDLWDRLHSAVSAMAGRLSDPDAIFRDSLVGNLVDLCQLLPRLNVFGDSHLETMRQEVESKLCGYKPQDLRDNPTARQQVAKSADDLLGKLEGYTG